MDVINSPDDGARQMPILPIQTLQSVTSGQIHVLLGALRALREVSADWVDDDGHTAPELDGGAKAAAEAAMIQAAIRLEEIIADPKRWTTESLPGIEPAIRLLYTQQIKTLKAQEGAFNAQRASQEEPIHPALLLRPRLMQVNGMWWCIAGEEPENRLCGTGLTPAAAMLDFSQRYYSQLPDGLDLGGTQKL